MSEEQQDAVIGRTLREYKDAKKTLAALYAEAEKIGNDLTGVGQALRSKHALDGVGGFRAFDSTTFPTVDQLTGLIADIEATRANKNRLSQILKDAGHQIAE